jgi:hypothetical protein
VKPPRRKLGTIAQRSVVMVLSEMTPEQLDDLGCHRDAAPGGFLSPARSPSASLVLGSHFEAKRLRPATGPQATPAVSPLLLSTRSGSGSGERAPPTEDLGQLEYRLHLLEAKTHWREVRDSKPRVSLFGSQAYALQGCVVYAPAYHASLYRPLQLRVGTALNLMQEMNGTTPIATASSTPVSTLYERWSHSSSQVPSVTSSPRQQYGSLDARQLHAAAPSSHAHAVHPPSTHPHPLHVDPQLMPPSPLSPHHTALDSAPPMPMPMPVPLAMPLMTMPQPYPLYHPLMAAHDQLVGGLPAPHPLHPLMSGPLPSCGVTHPLTGEPVIASYLTHTSAHTLNGLQRHPFDGRFLPTDVAASVNDLPHPLHAAATPPNPHPLSFNS